MFVINIFFIGLLLLSYLSMFVSPEKFWPLAFAGLAYPVFLIINLFFVLFWLVFLKKYFLFSLIAIVLGYNQIQNMFQFSDRSKTLGNENGIKVMSYNVRLFDLYNWRGEPGKTTRASIFELIYSESPDILCIQEYYSGSRMKADFADSISLKCGYKYRNIEFISKGTGILPFGLAIFSRYPVVNTMKLDFPNSKVNFCHGCDVKIGKDTIRVLNLHLESVKFGKEDYNFVGEIANLPQNNDKLTKVSRAIFGKMKNAYQKRAPQIETVVGFVKKSPYPVILTADFNDTPVSYCYRRMSNELDDAFADAGKGFGQTYSFALPLLRIDYLFHSESLRVTDLKTINKNFSDHYPLIAHVLLPG